MTQIHHVYALIDLRGETNKGLVSNIIVGDTADEANRLASMCYINGLAICIDDLAVHNGDIYDNGRFYKVENGTRSYEIVRVVSENESLAAYEKIIEDLKKQIEFLKGDKN